jgi:hypothetical protein
VPIPQFILDRIAQAQLGGPQISELLSNLSAAVDQLGTPGGILTLEFTSDSDRLQPGDVIPSIQLTLRRIGRPDADPLEQRDPIANRIGEGK